MKHILPHVSLKHFIKLMVGGHFGVQGLLKSAGSISMEEMKIKVQKGGSQAGNVIDALLELSLSAPTLPYTVSRQLQVMRDGQPAAPSSLL